MHLDKNLETVRDYEDKFEKLKVIVHSKEVATSDLRGQLAQADEIIRTKDAKIEMLQSLELTLKEQLQDLKHQMSSSLEDQKARFDQAKDNQDVLL